MSDQGKTIQDKFIELIYSQDTELAKSFFNEDLCLKDAIDFIHQLQAENAELRRQFEKVSYKASYGDAERSYIKKLKKEKADLERLIGELQGIMGEARRSLGYANSNTPQGHIAHVDTRTALDKGIELVPDHIKKLRECEK